MNSTLAQTADSTATRIAERADRRSGRRALTALVVLIATMMAVVMPAGSASAREVYAKSKDGCTIWVTKPTAISTWQRRVQARIRCDSTRTFQYGSVSVMNDVPNRADTVAASRSLRGSTLYAGYTYTWTSDWNTGSTNGYAQYGRMVIKLSNWSAAVVVESSSVDGVYY